MIECRRRSLSSGKLINRCIFRRASGRNCRYSSNLNWHSATQLDAMRTSSIARQQRFWFMIPPGPGSADQQSVLAVLRSARRLRRELLAGLVVALALIPEAIAFSIIAGVDPRVGLFAAFTMAVTIAVVGGRPAMISAATGATALVVAPLSRRYGVEYLTATVIVAGIFQLILGILGAARVLRLIPAPVMVGFVNALAILIFLSQLPQLRGVPWLVYPMVAVGVAVIVGVSKVTAVVPSPLVAIIVLTAATIWWGWSVPNVGDQGQLPRGLPQLSLPDVPLTGHALGTIAPYALAMAAVGLLESLVTAKIVDDLTVTRSNKTREALGQGFANIVTGLFGGMGGCAMLGQTMINVKIGGARTRISTLAAGGSLLLLVLELGTLVARIPMAALVAVMIMVAVTTMDWHSVAPTTLRHNPKSETFVMLCTVAATIATDNLAIGVVAGLSAARACAVANCPRGRRIFSRTRTALLTGCRSGKAMHNGRIRISRRRDRDSASSRIRGRRETP